jgi:hypothetical protein
MIYLIRHYLSLLVWTFRLGYRLGRFPPAHLGIAQENLKEAARYG